MSFIEFERLEIKEGHEKDPHKMIRTWFNYVHMLWKPSSSAFWPILDKLVRFTSGPPMGNVTPIRIFSL